MELTRNLHIVAIVRPPTLPALLTTPLTSFTTSSSSSATRELHSPQGRHLRFSLLFYFLRYIFRPSPNLVIYVSLTTRLTQLRRRRRKEEEEGLYLQLETRERVQTNKAKSKRRRASPT